MATANLSDFLRRLSRDMAAQTLADHSDRQLVERAVAGHDETSVQAIVYRHGPMVYRVCWRVLQQAQDTEDAFQATFLVLAQKLRALRRHASLASWLHGVAHRVALRAKGQAAAQRRRERQASRPELLLPDAVPWGELRSALDLELSRLPDRWRLPLILCYLEGRTQDQAAQQLGWSMSTLRRRLEEARAALGTRLKRCGLTLPAALSAVLVSDCLAAPAPAAGLIATTVEAAAGVAAGKTVTTATSATVAALTKGVLKAMVLNQLKMVMAGMLALTAVAGMGAGGLLYHAQGADTPGDSSPPVQNEKKQDVGKAPVQELRKRRERERILAAELEAARGEVLDLRNKLKAAQDQLEAAEKRRREFSDQLKDFLHTNHFERLERERGLKAAQDPLSAIKKEADKNAITWRTDYAQARKEAAEKEMPLLVLFHAPTPTADPASDAWTQHVIRTDFIPVMLPREGPVGKLMHISQSTRHTPTIILANSDGMVLDKLEGQLESGELVENLRRALILAKNLPKEDRPAMRRPPRALPQPEAAAARESEPAPRIAPRKAAQPALVVPENATITVSPDVKLNLRPVKTSHGMRVRLELPGVVIEAVRLRIDSNGKISEIQIGRNGEMEVRVLPKEQ